MKTYRLYTGDDGHSFVEEKKLNDQWLPDVKVAVKTLHYKTSPSGSSYSLHNAPAINYVITVVGTIEFETSLGVRFIVRPGDILLAEDVTGHGHSWRLLGDEPWIRYYAVYG
jgi:hypothetical protein